jgi:protein TonB
MKRYLNSFLITLVLYFCIVLALFSIFADEQIIVKKDKPSHVISLNHIELKPEPKKIKQEVKEEKPKVKEIKKTVKKEKKIIKKKKIEKIKKKVVKKKKIKKETKKVVKKRIPKKKEIKTKKIYKEKEVVKEFIKEASILEPITKEVVKEKISNPKKTNTLVKTNVKKEYLSKHLSLIRKYIKQNVHYPRSAKRLNIEGIVNVRFTLHSNGIVDNIVILNGHSRLKKSTINAVKDASSKFPKVKNKITIQLPIEYKLI